MERYRVLFENIDELFAQGCPLVIERYQLLLDQKENLAVLRIRLFNIGDETISKVAISVNCYNDYAEKIDTFNRKISDLNLKPNCNPENDIFITLNQIQTKKVSICINDVGYITGSNLDCSCLDLSALYKRPLLTTDENYVNIKRKAYEKDVIADYYPYNNSILRVCSCGKINRLMTVNCTNCRKTIDEINYCFDSSKMKTEQQFLNYDKSQLQEEQNTIDESVKKNPHQKLVELSIIFADFLFSILLVSIINPKLTIKELFHSCLAVWLIIGIPSFILTQIILYISMTLRKLKVFSYKKVIWGTINTIILLILTLIVKLL